MGDFRFAMRILRKSPAFFLTAVLSLALGIGANTTVFSAFRAVFLRPLPYAEPDRLVEIVKARAEGGTTYATLGDVSFFRQFAPSFALIGTYGPFRPLTMTGTGETAFLSATAVNARVVQREFFTVLGARPLLGRTLLPSDFDPGSPRVLVISTRLWREQFQGDPAIPGRGVMLDNASWQIVGVMPPEFQTPSSFFNMWIPDREPVPEPGTKVSTIARLRPGVTLRTAQAELNRILPALLQSYPESRRHIRIELKPFVERDEKMYSAFVMLCGAVGLLVLIGCLNVANLVIARSAKREVEFAVRSALGATRERLIRQILTESAVIAVFGGVTGIALAWAGNRALIALLPEHFPVGRLDQTRLDFAVLLFALVLSTLTAFVSGLGPALLLSRLHLKASRLSWRGALIVAEVALSLTLLIGAGLLIRSFVSLAQVETGFRPDHILSAMVPASTQLSKDKPALTRRLASILEHGSQLPGVRAAGLATAIPLGQINVSLTFALPEQPNEELPVNFRAVSAGYFPAMGTPVLAGRNFTPRDDGAAAKVAMVNAAFARKYFPDRSPVGQLLALPKDTTIVGIVADMHGKTPGAHADPELYTPFTQFLGPAPGATLLLRTQADPVSLASALRRTVYELYPDQPVSDVATMEARVSETIATPRLYMALLSIFAAVALTLTGIGIFGMMSYSVSYRTREFGIRMALGAQAADVVVSILGGGLRLIIIGVVLGVAGAWILSRFVESLLFGITPRDPVSFLAGAALLLLVGLIGCWFPARRATKVDPVVCLRAE